MASGRFIFFDDTGMYCSALYERNMDFTEHGRGKEAINMLAKVQSAEQFGKMLWDFGTIYPETEMSGKENYGYLWVPWEGMKILNADKMQQILSTSYTFFKNISLKHVTIFCNNRTAMCLKPGKMMALWYAEAYNHHIPSIYHENYQPAGELPMTNKELVN